MAPIRFNQSAGFFFFFFWADFSIKISSDIKLYKTNAILKLLKDSFYVSLSLSHAMRSIRMQDAVLLVV